MAHVVVLGGGLGGVIMAYEMKAKLSKEDSLTVVSDSESYTFVPSNPWVAVDWRKPGDITVALRPILEKRKIAFVSMGAKRVVPESNEIELTDGSRLLYDFLVISTGPDLAFDEIEGFGPDSSTVSVCTTKHATAAAKKWRSFVDNPAPIVVGAVQGASCFGPAYEFAFIMDTDLRRRKVRDRAPMTFITPEPYIGHLGLDGVGDTKSMLESALREKHIKWITNARIVKVEPGLMHVEEVNEDGSLKKKHELPFGFSMLLPAFRGVPAIRGIEGLVNPRGFVIVDKHQRNPTFPNIFAIGVCVAIPPMGNAPLAVGVPKTGFMIESMVTATVENIAGLLKGHEPECEATWNAVCLADFGDEGIAFVAQPQIPPRNVNWSRRGRWVHLAKIGFEKYFLRKVRRGTSEPAYERLALNLLGIRKLKEIKRSNAA